MEFKKKSKPETKFRSPFLFLIECFSRRTINTFLRLAYQNWGISGMTLAEPLSGIKQETDEQPEEPEVTIFRAGHYLK